MPDPLPTLEYSGSVARKRRVVGVIVVGALELCFGMLCTIGGGHGVFEHGMSSAELSSWVCLGYGLALMVHGVMLCMHRRCSLSAILGLGVLLVLADVTTFVIAVHAHREATAKLAIGGNRLGWQLERLVADFGIVVCLVIGTISTVGMWLAVRDKRRA